MRTAIRFLQVIGARLSGPVDATLTFDAAELSFDGATLTFIAG